MTTALGICTVLCLIGICRALFMLAKSQQALVDLYKVDMTREGLRHEATLERMDKALAAREVRH